MCRPTPVRRIVIPSFSGLVLELGLVLEREPFSTLGDSTMEKPESFPCEYAVGVLRGEANSKKRGGTNIR